MVIIWLIVAIVAGAGEILTTGLFLATLSTAAVLTAISALVFPLATQLAIFAALSLLGLLLVRPFMVHALGLQTAMPMGGPVPQHFVVGKRGVVTRTVDRNEGQVRIGDADYWSARVYEADDLIPVGTVVKIASADGLIARVVREVPQEPREASRPLIHEKGDIA